jgi:hypothetical protein
MREIAMRGEIPGPDQGELVRRIDMSMSDPISDMLTRIRNAQQAEKPSVSHARRPS